MSYQIVFTSEARKTFLTLNSKFKKSIAKKIDTLKADPISHNAKKLVGLDYLYRLKVGPIRILYQIEKDLLLVLIVKIGDRKKIYHQLPAKISIAKILALLKSLPDPQN